MNEEELIKLKIEIGKDYDLPPELAERLNGTNREELKQDAQQLQEAFKNDIYSNSAQKPKTLKDSLRITLHEATAEPEDSLAFLNKLAKK